LDHVIALNEPSLRRIFNSNLSYTRRRKMPGTVILSPPRRAKNPPSSFVLNQEGFFASLSNDEQSTISATCITIACAGPF